MSHHQAVVRHPANQKTKKLQKNVVSVIQKIRGSAMNALVVKNKDDDALEMGKWEETGTEVLYEVRETLNGIEMTIETILVVTGLQDVINAAVQIFVVEEAMKWPIDAPQRRREVISLQMKIIRRVRNKRLKAAALNC